MNYQSTLITARSNRVPQILNLRGRLILVPLKRIPLVLPAVYTALLCSFLPVYMIRHRPNFIIMQPNVHVLSAFTAFFASKLLRVKLVLDIRSIPVETAGLNGYLQKLWFFVSVAIAKRMFDGITIITPLMRREVCDRFRIDQSEVGVWTSGVSEGLFDPENLSLASSNLKNKLGLDGKFVVFFHGAFTHTRGLDESIEAMNLLKPKYSNIVLFLLGNGPSSNKLKSLIQKKNLQKNVIIHNPVEQSEVPQFINFCDVGIVPLPYNVYWRFQSPLKLLEYLSMKKVVIVSDIPAHRLVTNNEKCAIYLNSVTPEEIAKSVEYAYNNRDMLPLWGSIGRDIIQQKYTWAKVAKNLENYLKSI
jgi:glycosyltransferase involved in cell wall biosynthesis